MKEYKNSMSRRHFLGTGLAAAAAIALSSCNTAQGKTDLREYEPNLRDRLWMWGHGPETVRGQHGIPDGKYADMAEAIDYMGIPNVCAIRWQGQPEPPFDEYIKQFHKTKRVAWSIIDGAPQSYAQKKRWAFELREKMPNLVSFYLDDYFHFVKDDSYHPEESDREILPLDAIRNLHQEVKSLKQPTNLSMVIYSDALRDLGPGIKPHLDCCDIVSFWTWYATNLVALEDNFKKYREIVPDKPTLLGIYMWDFGNSRPITLELMKLQLDFALKKFRQGEIEGMIFHCTPLVDLGLEAVEYSRKWIAEHANVIR